MIACTVFDIVLLYDNDVVLPYDNNVMSRCNRKICVTLEGLDRYDNKLS